MGYVFKPKDLFAQILTSTDIFSSDAAEFSSLFQRILSMTLDTTLPATIRVHLLSFVISAFQSLDSGIVRKECAPLVSISIWHNLSSEKVRESKLGQSVQLQKAWRAAAKRYDAADDAVKGRLRFERAWLYTLILDFLNQAYNPKSKPGMYLERQWTEKRLTCFRKRFILRTISRVSLRFGEPVTDPSICKHPPSRSSNPPRSHPLPCFQR